MTRLALAVPCSMWLSGDSAAYAEVLYEDPAVTRSTMMGFPCLRYDGRFFASVDRTPGAARKAAAAAGGEADRRRARGTVRTGRAGLPGVGRGVQAGPAALAGATRRGQDPRGRRRRARIALAGFDAAGFTFLAGLERDNSKAYSDSQRDLYQRGLLEPAKAFVVALGELLTARVSTQLTDPVRLADLDTAVDDLLATGAELSEPTRVRVPAGIDPAGPAGRFAVRDSLYVTRRFPRPEASTTSAFPGWCATRLEPFAPVHRWLVRALTA